MYGMYVGIYICVYVFCSVCKVKCGHTYVVGVMQSKYSSWTGFAMDALCHVFVCAVTPQYVMHDVPVAWELVCGMGNPYNLNS